MHAGLVVCLDAEDCLHLVAVHVHHVWDAGNIRGLVGECGDVGAGHVLERELAAAGHKLAAPLGEAYAIAWAN